MSDLLTHWAVFEDCRRLAARDPVVEPLFARVIEDEREFARLGAITRKGARWIPEILTKTREQTPDAEDPARAERKLAFALGGVTHHACDVVLKPLLRKHGENGSIREVSAYYDVHVFRRVYLDCQEEPFTRFLTAHNQTTPGQALEAFVRSLFQRALLSSHTLAPDTESFDGWLDSLIDRVQPLYVDVALYTQAYADPDPEKQRRYGVETEFYRTTDPIISRARALQNGEQADLEPALAGDANRSAYGRALALGVEKLRETSAYWRGEADEPPDFRQKL